MEGHPVDECGSAGRLRTGKALGYKGTGNRLVGKEPGELDIGSQCRKHGFLLTKIINNLLKKNMLFRP